jgi:hypothetical protein
MAYSNSTQDPKIEQKHYIVLSDGSLREVKPGADTEFVRKIAEAALRRKAARPRKQQRSASRRKPSRRTNYAAQVVERGAAMAGLVMRVNEPKQLDPTLDDNFVIIRTAGYTAYMSRIDGSVSYA